MARKAVMLDYIGTLVTPRNYSLEASRLKLHDALCKVGLRTHRNEFIEAYKKAHEKYRVIRYEKLKEVTNAVWVAEALAEAGCAVPSNENRLKAALDVFFKDFTDSLELKPDAAQLLKTARERCKVGLISNFTYAPAIHASLRKLCINEFFDTIVVSEEVGWRKPHKRIFETALKRLQVGPAEAVFVGDSPTEDIHGARILGIRTVFVPSNFFSATELAEAGEETDFIVRDLQEISQRFSEIILGESTAKSEQNHNAGLRKKPLNKKPR